MVPPSDSPPRNSSSLLRSDRRWPSARITVAVIGLQSGDIAQPAQGSDRHRRPIQPLDKAPAVALDRARARVVGDPEQLTGTHPRARRPAEPCPANIPHPAPDERK